ncbi:LacI family DNA-binding transcriptional regulator [Pseudoflavonifractor phocaeensis]|uniref:LacI family DNA-binding transcriptional regulator n=1 Tax=Pseudoflavonifractor phocaeensis TaxID=1870988 RepID=UPI00210C4316|nr:LacI family DNA-binding transcriptional regulator [Pseudoflavonifractor phocaeensis]MCQ4863028.1 LacI family transcriptional regulator [Pseudoflavonifractor phocaeensis]
MVTLKDIAREAGVSVMTVSNVVNGNLSKVSKENAQRIREIIERRGYVPNASARSLAKNRANIIAIILRGAENENTLENPHNAALVGTIIQKIQKRGYYTMVNMMKCREDITQSLRTWNVDGAVFLGMFDDEIEEMCAASDIPMVFIDSYSSVRQLSNVGIDDYKGGRLAARHLIARGHRSIAFVSPPVLRTGVVQHRFAGFCDELEQHGISFRSEHQFVLESDVRPEDTMELGRRLAQLREEFSAVFVTSDQIASYLIQGMRSTGIRIPDDMSIIGFDDLMICRQMTPQLTTIAQDLEEKARLSVDILFRRLSAPAAPAESLVLDVTLVERESVAVKR